jgi:hypothetical protein
MRRFGVGSRGATIITIGIRATPKAVTFAVYDSRHHRVLNVEEIKIPAAFPRPDGLKYLRSNLLDVLREFKVSRAGIRAIEPSSQQRSIERIELEGVIQEAFASSELASYYVGHISSISARIGIPREDFKPLVDGDREYPIENWRETSKEGREAILCAIGAADA